MPQRIIFLMNGWDSTSGGIQTVNRELVAAIAMIRPDLRCTVIVPSVTQNEIDDAFSKGVELIAGKREGDWSSPMLSLAREKKSHASDVLAVVGHSYFTGREAIDLRNSLFPKALSVQFVHMSPLHLEHIKEYKQDNYVKDREKKVAIEVEIASGADLVVCVGPRLHRAMHDILVARPNIKAKVVSINCGLSNSRVSDRAMPLRPTLLCLGRTDSLGVKGLDIFAYAAGYLTADWNHPSTRDAQAPQFVVRGAKDDGEALEHRLIGLAEEVGATPTLIIRPYTADRTELDADLRGASAFMMPSREEGFGLVACEAISLGVPTLVSQNSGLAEVIREVAATHHLEVANCVIPMGSDPKAIGRRFADAALEILIHEAKATSFANMLAERLRPVCSWQAGARKLLDELGVPVAERASTPEINLPVAREAEIDVDADTGGQMKRSPQDASAILAANRASISEIPGLLTIGVQEAFVATFARGSIPTHPPRELFGVPLIARESDPIKMTADWLGNGGNLYVDGEPRGTANFIQRDAAGSYFLTAAHVLQFGTELEIRLGSLRFAAQIAEKDERADWALLAVPRVIEVSEILRPIDPILGERVRMIIPNRRDAHGVISAVELSALSVQDHGGTHRGYEGLFEVTMTGEVPLGVSGALLATEEGSPLGMVVAGTFGTTRLLATPLRLIFKGSARLRSSKGALADPRKPMPMSAFMPTSDQALRQILKSLRSVEPFNCSTRRYFRGRLADGSSVVVAPVPRVGNIGAASATTALLLDNEVSQLCVVGVCGGLAPTRQALTDVVVATDVIYYEPGVIGGTEPIQRMRVSGAMAPSFLVKAHALVANYAQVADGPRVHLGTIASGEKVIKSAKDFAEIMASWRNVLAVDMESAGVFEAAASLGKDVPIAVVRGIVDFADNSKNDLRWDDATVNAVRVALELISRSADAPLRDPD
jgi:nucleoside phosphorylase/glycosyltransferase involved in cell wall biosynthesis